MRLWRRLDVRLFASYALVALVVFAALAVTVRIVAPARFDDDIKTIAGSRADERESHTVLVDSLNSSLWIALAASLGAAAIVSSLVARRIVRPVRDVRDATRRLANGHYEERVTEPAELELAELAHDVNRLAVELETTERRRARLVSEVAHEMRTPLTTIEGYVEGMLDGVFEPNEEVLVVNDALLLAQDARLTVSERRIPIRRGLCPIRQRQTLMALVAAPAKIPRLIRHTASLPTTPASLPGPPDCHRYRAGTHN